MEKIEHRKIGADCFNKIWTILDKPTKTDDDYAEAMLLSFTSLWHWKQGGEPIHEQRGEWMISRVYAVFGHGDMALFNAKRCLALTLEHDLKDYDLAFAYEAMSRALALLQHQEESNLYFDLGKKAAESIAKEEDKTYFLSELASIPR